MPDQVQIESDEPAALKEKATDAWHRQLNDGRVEFMVKAPGFRMRCTAPEEEAWEAIEMFERWTGLHVDSERRPRRRPHVMPGQQSLLMEAADG